MRWAAVLLLLASCVVAQEAETDGLSKSAPSPYLHFQCYGNEHFVHCNNDLTYHSQLLDEPGKPNWIIDVCLCVTFVLCGGIAAGLTIGLMSLDAMNMEILVQSGTPSEQKMAKRLQPLLANRHWVLVTLLLLNAGVNEALPLFLNRLMHEVLTIIVSVTAILAFGEIIPQAVCARYGLHIGYFLSPLVWFLLFITYPISRPIAWLLDVILGGAHQPKLFERQQLRAIVQMHTDEEGKENPLTTKEAAIIRGALDMREKYVLKCMTPLDKVFMIDYNRKLDKATLRALRDSGHSRIPVYMGEDKQQVVGMIIVKSLLLVDANAAQPLSAVHIRKLPIVPCDKPLYDMLKLFQSGKSHMALVVDTIDHTTLLGIITLEDVIEELIQEEIADETDDPFDAVRAATLRKSLQKVVDSGLSETLQIALTAADTPPSHITSPLTPISGKRAKALTSGNLSRYGKTMSSRSSFSSRATSTRDASSVAAGSTPQGFPLLETAQLLGPNSPGGGRAGGYGS